MKALRRLGWWVTPLYEPIARELVQWRNPSPYEVYNFSEEDIQELLREPYFACLNPSRQCVGFFCTGGSAQVPRVDYDERAGWCDIGLGLHPNLTGQGLGYDFVCDILEFVGDDGESMGGDDKACRRFRLTVVEENQRAISVYQRASFREIYRQEGYVVMIRD